MKKVGENVLIVSSHITKQQNQMLQQQHAGELDPVALSIKKSLGSNVFVNFIPSDSTEPELRAEFEKVGSIVSLKMGKHPLKSFQHAYVLYETVAEAQMAIRKYHDSTVFGSRRPIYVDFWISKAELDQERKQKSENDLNRLLKSLFNQPP